MGSLNDPLSLHKYLYVHGDPVTGTDPNGREFSLGGLLGSMSFQAGLRGMATTLVGRTITGAFVGASLSAISAALARDATAGSIANAALTGAIFGAAFGALGFYSETAALVGGLSLIVVLSPFIWANVKSDWEKGDHAKAVFDTALLVIAVPAMASRLAAIAVASAVRSSAATASIYTQAAAMMEYARMARAPATFANTTGQLPRVAAGAFDSIVGESAGGLSGQSSGAIPTAWHPKVQPVLAQAESIYAASGSVGNPPGNCAEWRALNALAWKLGPRFTLGKHIRIQAMGTGQSPKFPVLESVEACPNCKGFLGNVVTLLSPE